MIHNILQHVGGIFNTYLHIYAKNINNCQIESKKKSERNIYYRRMNYETRIRNIFHHVQ